MFKLKISLKKKYPQLKEGRPRGVMVKAMVYEIVAREFELQSRYYVHFRTVLLGEWLWH